MLLGKFPAVQWLGLRSFTAQGVGSIPGIELRPHKPQSVATKIMVGQPFWR